MSETFDIYYVGEGPLGPDYDDVRGQVTAGWNEIFAEDQGVWEGMQAGRASPGVGHLGRRRRLGRSGGGVGGGAPGGAGLTPVGRP